MKKYVIAGLLACMAVPSQAAVHVGFLEGVPVSALANFNVINNFDTADGITGSNFSILNGPETGGAVIPLSDSAGTNYLSVLANGIANISLSNVSAFAFEWGSLDRWNTLKVFGNFDPFTVIPGSGYLAGNPANGNQHLAYTNGTLVVYGDSGEKFSGLQLTSGNYSFEIDNLATGSVPELDTWAMMLIGFAAMGYAYRTSNRRVAFN